MPLDKGGVDVAALERILDEPAAVGHVRMIYTIASCQSPTGTILDRSRRVRLARLAEERDIVIVQDDTYGEILYDDLDAPPLIGLAPDRTLHLGSFSKTIAPGIRLGWAAGPAELDCGRGRGADRPRWVPGSPAGGRPVPRVGLRRAPTLDHVVLPGEARRVGRRAQGALLRRGDVDGSARRLLPLAAATAAADVDSVHGRRKAEGVSFLAGPYFSAGTPDRTGVRLAYGELAAPELAEGARRLGRALERTAALIQ